MLHHYSRRAWSVFVVIGSILTAAAIWNMPAYESRAVNARHAHPK